VARGWADALELGGGLVLVDQVSKNVRKT